MTTLHTPLLKHALQNEHAITETRHNGATTETLSQAPANVKQGENPNLACERVIIAGDARGPVDVFSPRSCGPTGGNLGRTKFKPDFRLVRWKERFIWFVCSDFGGLRRSPPASTYSLRTFI